MVLSKINPKISYPELKKIYDDDSKMEADMYEIEVKGVDIVIAVGNAKKDFEKEGLLFYPVYLVKTNNKVTQIGVYEIPSDDMLKYLDEDNNLDIEKLDDPLIFKFVTKDSLQTKRFVPKKDDYEVKEKVVEKGDKDEADNKEKDEADNKEKDSDSEDGAEGDPAKETDIPDFRKDIFVLTPGVAIPPLLREETKQAAKDIREKYKEETTDTWVQKFMQNKNYAIIDNEGGGDCLFATIRDAFSQIAQQTSIVKLRKKLADEVTQDTFLTYKELYDMHNTSMIKDTNDVKELAKEYQATREKFTQVFDREEQKQLVGGAKKIKAQHDSLVREKKVTAQLLQEFRFMKGVDTLEKFQQKIKTCDFWADTWAISTLERVLNIKFILLSSESYKAKDLQSVLQCGQLNDDVLKNKGEGGFKPDYYIIVEYSGTHYKLISYKRKQIFTFNEVPYDIKKLVMDKCMEKNAGPFSLIPDFIKFKKDIEQKRAAKSNGTDSQSLKEEIQFEELSEAKLRGLYDDAIVLSFYHNSAAKPLPGRGSGEKIPKEQIKEFAPLATIADWRRKLDDSWLAPFTLDNHSWASVEHYYQAAKFKKNNQEFYLSFSLDSGTDLAKDSEMAKSAGSKNGKHGKELIRPKEVQIDPDFMGANSEKEHRLAQTAKFSQIPEMKQLLFATLNAKLVHHRQGNEPELMEGLMLIRDKLRKEM
jgi:predicted NAD-dependent protein-ADP-ribosyltransferase YbiA (DUF1768 family)